MSDDHSRPSQMSPAQVAALPRTPVEVVDGAPFIKGDVVLSDGTVLTLRLVIPAVSRIDGLTDPGGNPAYELQTSVVVGVKQTKKGG